MDDTFDIVHAVDLAQIGGQRAQVFRIAHADGQLCRRGDAILIDFRVDLVELGLALRDDGHDIAEPVAAII